MSITSYEKHTELFLKKNENLYSLSLSLSHPTLKSLVGPNEHPMKLEKSFWNFLSSITSIEIFYNDGGKEPRYDRIEAHQELLRRGELVRWVDLPIDAHIIFFSHEWVGWNHPDPHGVQLKTFLRVMQRLRSGEISQVEMNVFHTLMYKKNHVVKAEKWQDMLSRAYVLLSKIFWEKTHFRK